MNEQRDRSLTRAITRVLTCICCFYSILRYAILPNHGCRLSIVEWTTAELFLEKDDGTFESIYDEDVSFSQGMNYVFYATLGDVEEPYYGVQSFGNNSGALLKMEIAFDDYPWEIGWQVTTSDGEVVIYRPPRYYYRQVGRSASETFAIPLGDKQYNLTVVDTYGDGLLRSSTFYRLSDAEDNTLVESQFLDTAREEKSFRFNAKGITFDGDDSAGNMATLGSVGLLVLVGSVFCLSMW